MTCSALFGTLPGITCIIFELRGQAAMCRSMTCGALGLCQQVSDLQIVWGSARHHLHLLRVAWAAAWLGNLSLSCVGTAGLENVQVTGLQLIVWESARQPTSSFSCVAAWLENLVTDLQCIVWDSIAWAAAWLEKSVGH